MLSEKCIRIGISTLLQNRAALLTALRDICLARRERGPKCKHSQNKRIATKL